MSVAKALENWYCDMSRQPASLGTHCQRTERDFGRFGAQRQLFPRKATRSLGARHKHCFHAGRHADDIPSQSRDTILPASPRVPGVRRNKRRTGSTPAGAPIVPGDAIPRIGATMRPSST